MKKVTWKSTLDSEPEQQRPLWVKVVYSDKIMMGKYNGDLYILLGDKTTDKPKLITDVVAWCYVENNTPNWRSPDNSDSMGDVIIIKCLDRNLYFSSKPIDGYFPIFEYNKELDNTDLIMIEKSDILSWVNYQDMMLHKDYI